MAGAGFRAKFAFDTTSFVNGLKAAQIEYDRRSKRAITKGALLLEREIKKELSQKGTGTEYFKSRGVRHIASAPGHAPAVDTGRLRASITHLVEREFASWVAQVGTNVEYGAHLEFGTTKMQARPFMLSTLTRIKPQLIIIFQKELQG